MFQTLVALLLLLPSSQPQRPVRVVMDTDLGQIEIEIDAANAPATAANFLKYVDAGLYDGGRFHRTVRPDNQREKPVKIAVIQGAARVNLAVVPVREASPPAGSLIGVRVRRVQRVRIQSMDILN